MSTIEKLQTNLREQERRIQKLEDESALKDTIIDELQHFKNQEQVPNTQSENQKDTFNLFDVDVYNDHDRNTSLRIHMAKQIKGIYEDKTNRQSKH